MSKSSIDRWNQRERRLAKYTEKIYAPQEHRFFDELISMLWGILGTHTMLEIFHLSNTPSGMSLPTSEELVAPIHDMNSFQLIPIVHAETFLAFAPFEIIASISLGSWPQFLQMWEIPKSDIGSIQPKIPQRHFSKITPKIIGHPFANYYESMRTRIKSQYKSDLKKWPSVLNFARVIRNGISHNFRINFDNPNASIVTWKNWSFGPSNNGDEFLTNNNGLKAGDLIVLMEEMDAQIP